LGTLSSKATKGSKEDQGSQNITKANWKKEPRDY